MLFAKTTAAVYWICIIADLDKQQILIGVTALSQGCCQPVLQSSLEQWEYDLPRTVLQCIWFESLQTWTNSKS